MTRLWASPSVSVPLSKVLINDYLPTTLTHDDYPGLLGPGQTSETIAAGVALIAYNWPKNTDRYRRSRGSCTCT